MKRLLTLILAMFLIGSIALAESLDYASMTDKELQDVIDGARNELSTRKLNFEGTFVLFDQDGATLYLTGRYKINKSAYTEMEAIFINNTGRSARVSVDDVYVNGWKVSSSGPIGCDSGKKVKGTLSMSLSGAEISTFEEIEEIEFHISVLDESDYSRFITLDPITVVFNS